MNKRIKIIAILLLGLGMQGLQAQTTGTFVDSRDDKVYKIVTIGTQVWMAKNLNADKFLNGDTIPLATSANEWYKASINGQPAWCYYNNEPENGNIYGKLYNWYAVNDPRGLAPEGWHIPSDAEWTTLIDYLGGKDIAGGKLKDNSNLSWDLPNTGATNETGFSALPGGYRTTIEFDDVWSDGYWWSATEGNNTKNVRARLINAYSYSVLRLSYGKGYGFSVRCVKD